MKSQSDVLEDEIFAAIITGMDSVKEALAQRFNHEGEVSVIIETVEKITALTVSLLRTKRRENKRIDSIKASPPEKKTTVEAHESKLSTNSPSKTAKKPKKKVLKVKLI